MTWLPDDVVRHLREVCTEPDLTGTRYRLISELGRGGMGIVYLCEDTVLGREVALKVLDDPAEALTLARLEHPGVIPVHDAGVLPDGRRFYAMKRVAGERLDRHLEGVPSLAARMRIFLQVCETVAFAHSRGVRNTDLKPANVMVGEFGEVLLIDWGVRAGTPGFAAPEREGDARSDVYSLGAMLRAMLPEGAPKLLRAVAAKAMRDDPAGRYESVRALMGDVGRFLDGEPVEAYRENVWERSVRVLGKHSTLAALVAAYLVMRGLVLFFFGR